MEFVARQFLVHRVHGRFATFGATAVVTDDPWHGLVHGTVATASVDTGDATRDAHLRSGDFFDAARWPTMGVEGRLLPAETGARRFHLDGRLTIRDITVPVLFEVQLRPAHRAGTGPLRELTTVSARATAEVDRKAFGLRWNPTIETGGVIVGDQVDLVLELIAHRQTGSG